ncbi:phycobilisome rod-core linker polypeptide [Prochlorococcus marinus]|uniref:phycobilisome rod-core linker polypeptide n=1 Tax=Prochlorococcus marinus TaxID=1219 RepID=UPI0022B3374A|nr:phycobilisome rod-core linker polypeptide [Prochlorococcus marinus]
MPFISKHQFEIKLSDISDRASFSYGKTRASGSKDTSYIMHIRSACMPGQEQLFVNTSKSNSSDAYSAIQSRSLYKRERYIKQRNSIGLKYTHTANKLFTYKKFSPFSDQSLQIAIIASYKQIFGNIHIMQSQRLIDLERRLRNGDIPIREFIRGLAQSNLYRSNFFEKVSQTRFIELNFMHLLGRPLLNIKELQNNISLIKKIGFQGHIDTLINSLEYEEFFGADTVPYQRCWNSPCGSKTSSFIKTASFRKGFATSDSVIYN